MDSGLPIADSGLDPTTSSVFGMVVIGTVFALIVIDIFHLFQVVLVSCLNRSSLLFLVYPMLRMFCVLDTENLDAFRKCKRMITK